MPDPLVKDLFVRLNAEELQARSDHLASSEREYESIDRRRKAAMKAFKDDLEKIRVRILSLATVVEERQEIRPVECIWRANTDNHTMELYRVDSGDLVNIRAMTEAERQSDLFVDGQNASPCRQCDMTFENFAEYIRHRREAHPMEVTQPPPGPASDDITIEDLNNLQTGRAPEGDNDA